MLEELKKQVCQANLKLHAEGLVVHTWGNVSGVDASRKHVVIKPSGVGYDQMTCEKMVVVSLDDGEVAEGDLVPSSDTPTHLELYRAFEDIGGVAHTHSFHATAWAQAGREIPPLGTTHADQFCGPVPCTRMMSQEEIATEYEANTGRVVVERLANFDPMQVFAVLVVGHGPFTWGASVDEAVHNSVMLEYVAHLAAETLRIEPYPKPLRQDLLARHFFRKHGKEAYYGQR